MEAPKNSYTHAEFTQLYADCLLTMVRKYPHEYGFGEDKVGIVAAKMCDAIRSGSFNNDGRGIRELFRRLGIKNTQRDIDKFYSERVTQ